jgi:hypothetical protein
MNLNESQQRTLRAAVNRIIPADDYPGAWKAGVGDYLARQFEGDLRPEFDAYREGLNSLEGEAIVRYQQSFCSLPDTEQDTLLKLVEQGEVMTTWAFPPVSFFRLLTETTAEGFYSEPEQGGNRDGVSWAMTGFE